MARREEQVLREINQCQNDEEARPLLQELCNLLENKDLSDTLKCVTKEKVCPKLTKQGFFDIQSQGLNFSHYVDKTVIVYTRLGAPLSMKFTKTDRSFRIRMKSTSEFGQVLRDQDYEKGFRLRLWYLPENRPKHGYGRFLLSF